VKFSRNLLSIPNLLSFARIFLIPLFVYLIFMPSRNARALALLIFIIASFTDLLDGWSARKLKQESEEGKFLDPLADKILVVSALVALLLLDPLIPLWMILIIAGRDILITLLRYFAVQKGGSLKTSRFGKIKTAYQMVSIILIIVILIARKEYIKVGGKSFLDDKNVWDIMNSELSLQEISLIVAPYWIMFLATMLTAFSGFRYIYTNWKLFWPDRANKNLKEK